MIYVLNSTRFLSASFGNLSNKNTNWPPWTQLQWTQHFKESNLWKVKGSVAFHIERYDVDGNQKSGKLTSWGRLLVEIPLFTGSFVPPNGGWWLGMGWLYFTINVVITSSSYLMFGWHLGIPPSYKGIVQEDIKKVCELGENVCVWI